MIDNREEILVVGDVHGVLTPLRKVLAYAFATKITTVFLGDYVNRGPNSRAVIETLIHAKKTLGNHLILLRGNHEVALLDFLATGDMGQLIKMGGLSTVKSYLGDATDRPFKRFKDEFPIDHKRMLESTEIYFETPNYLISHTGLNPNNPKDRSLESMVLGSFRTLFSPHANFSKKLVVAGHYVQRDGEPFMSDRFICLDTGCGSRPGAPLTAMLLPSRRTMKYGGSQI
ncbi:metallophosphoesterase family protein [Umezawaea beigongshangensis]|uniref:metallophosphoesterase family protein n=1 Tax=Umezawaea beigongshangensis TaxID=2780383 RepID=UPI0018F271BF|nr:metallophosphoesterase family protein [Umezawaea beigongshangensis]